MRPVDPPARAARLPAASGSTCRSLPHPPGQQRTTRPRAGVFNRARSTGAATRPGMQGADGVRAQGALQERRSLERRHMLSILSDTLEYSHALRAPVPHGELLKAAGPSARSSSPAAPGRQDDAPAARFPQSVCLLQDRTRGPFRADRGVPGRRPPAGDPGRDPERAGILPFIRAASRNPPARAWLLTVAGAPLMKGVTESMAGRAAVLQLLPFSATETPRVSVLRGGFPRPSGGRVRPACGSGPTSRHTWSVMSGPSPPSATSRLPAVPRAGREPGRADAEQDGPGAPLGVSMPTVAQWLAQSCR